MVHTWPWSLFPFQDPYPVKKKVVSPLSTIVLTEVCPNPNGYGPGRHQAQNWQGIMSKIEPNEPIKQTVSFHHTWPFKSSSLNFKKTLPSQKPQQKPSTPPWNSTTCQPP